MRFSDTDSIVKTLDFSHRKSYGNPKHIAFIYLVLIAIAFLLVMNRSTLGSEVIFLVLMLGIMIAITLHSIYRMQRNLDLITEIDFQNALLFSGIIKDYDFSLMVKEDHSFAFVDEGFKEHFPTFSPHGNGLEAFLEIAGFSSSDGQRLFSAMSKGKGERFILPMMTENAEVKQMIITVFPIKRPKGFCLIQGRKFAERHITRPQQNNEQLSYYKHIQYLANSLSYGAFVLSPDQKITYMNKPLLDALNYDIKDIEKRIKITDILYHSDGIEPNKTELPKENVTREVNLRRKNGSLLKATLEQKIIKDSAGNIEAIIGLISERIER